MDQVWPRDYTEPVEARSMRPSWSWGPSTPRGTYAHLRWPATDSHSAGFDSFEWELTPELDTSQGYFWAHQFALRDSGWPASGGYAGLQANGVYAPGTAKVAIFSVWNALDAEGTGVAQPFGGEGEGYQTLIRYPWRAGQRYELRVESCGRDARGNSWWRATVGEMREPDASEIGRILVPASWGKLDASSVVWTELFYPPIRRCDDMECASAIWSRCTANGGTVEPISVEPRFGGPSRCRNSRIAILGDGGIRQQMGLPTPPSSSEPASAEVV